MFVTILSIIDILAGISLAIPNFLGFYLGIIMLLKGISSIVGSFASGFFFEIMGFIDLITGILLIFSFNIPWFWILPVLKGIFCLLIGFGK